MTFDREDLPVARREVMRLYVETERLEARFRDGRIGLQDYLRAMRGHRSAMGCPVAGTRDDNP